MRASRILTGALGVAVGGCLLLSQAAGVAPAAGAAVPAPQAGTAQQRQPGGIVPGHTRVPAPGHDSVLSAVGCSPAGQCWADGSYLRGRRQIPQSELFRWTGSRWQAVSIPQARTGSSLAGISCPSPRYCLATGWTTNIHGHTADPQVLRWDGTTWSVASAPAGMRSLGGVSCTAPNDCWVLGGQNNRAAHWNGHRWGRPRRLPLLSVPNGIACVSAADCWAVGYYVKPGGLNLYNLVVHWDGRTWSAARVPQPSGGDNQLHAVTCVSAADCLAAGSDNSGTSPHTRNEVLRWNGSRWSVVPTPKGPRINGELLAIECLARPDCWAVGDDEGASETLHWNGRHWSLVPSPDPGGDSFLFGVQCLGPADCLAVGFSHVPPTQNLALHWNGTKWVSV
jgi:hypothetical protein